MGLVHFSRTSRLTSLMIDDMLCALRSVRRTWITFGSSSPPSHVGRCAWRIFQADTALPTLDRPQRARDKNLRWHFVQDAIDGTLSVYLKMTKVRSAITGSSLPHSGSLRHSMARSDNLSFQKPFPSPVPTRAAMSFADSATVLLERLPCKIARFSRLFEPEGCFTSILKSFSCGQAPSARSVLEPAERTAFARRRRRLESSR
jgi:hypothetical protein